MQSNHFVKAAIFAMALVLVGFICWELNLRSKGISLDYDDSPALWARHREKVYEPREKTTVFIGSSRIKYDLDQPTWNHLTGEEPVQLAIEGASPIPVLQHLADDEKFNGKLVIDVTEILFFNTSAPPYSEPKKNITYYKDETPSQRISVMLNHVAESKLLLLDKWNYSTNAMLDKLEIPSRKGVFVFPVFPLDFGRTDEHRQARMTTRFLADTNLQNRVKWIWKYLGDNMREPPPSGKNLEEIFKMVKTSVDKIKQRGGEVIFIRTPSSGPFFMGENMGFPREQYWNRLLHYTNTKGLHFADDAATAGLQCPEFSHLSPQDAVAYTRALVHSLEQQGWKFNKTTM